MSFEWKTSKGVLGSYFELDDVSLYIEYETDDDSTYLRIISGELPSGLVFNKSGDRYSISGKLDSVPESTIYNFTIRAYSGDKTYDRNFIIIVESYEVEWLSPTLFATTTEYTYLSEYFKLKNPNGNEVFKKISGELPDGVQINNFGLCYGTIGYIGEFTDYQFRVGVFINDELTLYKDFIIEVKTLSDLSQPIWITQEGNIGKLNFNDKASIKLMTYEPNNLPLNYEIIQGILPTGLSLNQSTGTIYGTVATENHSQWDFTVSWTNGYKVITRTFNIVTNEIVKGDNIVWNSDTNLGEVSVGAHFSYTIDAVSNYPITYDIISGNLPKGLKITKSGEIYGICYYQTPGIYEFTLHARNVKTESIKTFFIKVNKGMGFNSLRAYFYLNLEYQNSYSNIKKLFDYEYAYHNYDDNYYIPYKPEIYVADLYCYDKVLLQEILKYDTYMKLIPNPTKVKNITQEDDAGNVTHKYDVYYKDFISTNNSNQEEFLNYKSAKHYIKFYDGQWVDYYTEEPVRITSTIYDEEVEAGLRIINDDLTYDVGYIQEGMYYRNDDQTVVFGNPEILAEITYNQFLQDYEISYYYMSPLERIYVTKNDIKRYYDKNSLKVLFSIDINKVLPITLYETRHYIQDTNIVYVNVPSIETMRHRLEQKIYVDTLTEDVWYDINTEEIVEPKYDKVYEIWWDEEQQTYLFDFDVMPYVNLMAYEPISQETDDAYVGEDGGQGRIWDYVYLQEPAEYGIISVKYQHFDVVNSVSHKVYRDLIFKFPGINELFMVDSTGKVRFVAKTNIEERTWYVYNNELSSAINHKIVLPYINSEDILNDGHDYFQFFNKDNEDLPEWMNNTYFPKIELFYSEPGQNYDNQQKINKFEEDNYQLNGEPMSFYCLTFKPKYNKEIRPFDIHFDYHNNPYSPHTLV